MKINISKKSASLVGGVIAVLLAGTFFLLGSNSSSMSMDHSGQSSSEYSADEVMFAQMMILHHEQAVLMSELALKNSTDPKIISLANQIAGAQGPEIKEMEKWIGGVMGTDHGGHNMDMNGMLTDTQVAELAQATGPDFDRLFLSGMIAHHEGALEMAAMIADSTKADVKLLYENIMTSQSAEITEMKALLASY
jgi:uncharacterized protein (DUF305 family)